MSGTSSSGSWSKVTRQQACLARSSGESSDSRGIRRELGLSHPADKDERQGVPWRRCHSNT
jgi:hypothetical protein